MTEGLSVLVGATGDLGAAIAHRLVHEGHTLLAVARDHERLEDLASRYPEVETCRADVAEDGCIQQMRTALRGRAVRMAVHAPSAPPGSDVLTVESRDVLAAVDIKVNGLLRLVRACSDSLQGNSRIVALAGSLGLDPVPGSPAAGIANAAQMNLVRQLNRAFASRGVTCHIVAPGPVETGRLRAMAAATAREQDIPVEDVLQAKRDAMPLGRLLQPEEVAWAVARLADPEASALAGWTLLLDGGRRTAVP